MTQKKLKVTTEVSVLLRQAKSHINLIGKYEGKVKQNWLAAGGCLTEAKEKIPHGQWEAYLKEYEINPRTARVAMQFHRDPEAYEAKKESDRQYRAQEREEYKQERKEAVKEKWGTTKEEVFEKIFGKENMEKAREEFIQKEQAKEQKVVSLVQRELTKKINKLTDEQKQLVINFITQTFGEK